MESFKTPILYRLNNTHMKIHSEERNFKCAICGKAFKNNKQLRNHRRWHREPQQPDAVDPPDEEVPSPTDPAVCSETCMDTEPPAGAAIDHQKTRPTPMAMKCVKCGLRFTGKRQLRAHMDAKHPADGVEHAPEATAGKHRCLLCGMVFKTRYLLQSHSAKHSDEKRFKPQLLQPQMLKLTDLLPFMVPSVPVA
ncbi:myeloid zinc finger 1-like [Anopheles nili]|uniref:myeloid zinc finger 1-like n=1 Tax=Anopheles nili TaxID=185578 RepID=UPI00237BEF6B|nr:myeloid zinc finger 1-like [Anopheles nili]